MRAAILGVVFACCCFPGRLAAQEQGAEAPAVPQAAAEPVELPPMFHVDVGGGTVVPLMVGAELTIEDLPHRFLLQLQLGWMPDPYVSLINEVLLAFDVYDELTGDLITGSLDTSGVTRLHAGWRPFESAGLEAYLGYTVVTLGGGIGSVAAAERAGADFMGRPPPAIPLEAEVHLWSVALGWRFMLSDTLVLRTSLGYTNVFDAKIRVNIPTTGLVAAVVQAAEQAVSDYVTDVFQEFVKAPVLSVSLSYRLQ